MSKFDSKDVFYLLGLSLSGAGLFFMFGVGEAMFFDGAVLLLLAAFGKY